MVVVCNAEPERILREHSAEHGAESGGRVQRQPDGVGHPDDVDVTGGLPAPPPTPPSPSSPPLLFVQAPIQRL